MTLTARATTNEMPAYEAMLAYEAPFLIEKLCKENITETPEEARALFAEFKKYLWLVSVDDSVDWKMYSLRVDEVWHQFVLFTREYIDFCMQFFHLYVQHNPSNAPDRPLPGDADEATPREPASFEDFKARYEELFAAPLPDLWCDEKSVTLHRRIHSNRFHEFALRRGNGVVELVGPRGVIVLSVSDLATDALEFVARTPSFYVRELPGQLTEEEKIGLVATMVEYDLLRVAP
jgi:hypothetical protein